MPKDKPATHLKVRLNPENSTKVRDKAAKEFTTPPRFVNKIVTQHFLKKP